MAPLGLPQTTGTATANNAGATAAIIAAPGATKTLRVTRGVVAVTAAAVGGSGLVQLANGSTVIMQWDANAVGSYPFDFGDLGYPLSQNTALNLIVASAVTTQATATCAAVALSI